MIPPVIMGGTPVLNFMRLLNPTELYQAPVSCPNICHASSRASNLARLQYGGSLRRSGTEVFCAHPRNR